MTYLRIPYGYWGMESNCKSQELGSAAVMKTKQNIKLLFNHLLMIWTIIILLQT